MVRRSLDFEFYIRFGSGLLKLAFKMIQNILDGDQAFKRFIQQVLGRDAEKLFGDPIHEDDVLFGVSHDQTIGDRAKDGINLVPGSFCNSKS